MILIYDNLVDFPSRSERASEKSKARLNKLELIVRPDGSWTRDENDSRLSPT